MTDRHVCTLMQESFHSSEKVVMANRRSRSGEATEGSVHQELGRGGARPCRRGRSLGIAGPSRARRAPARAAEQLSPPSKAVAVVLSLPSFPRLPQASIACIAALQNAGPLHVNVTEDEWARGTRCRH